MSGKGRNKTIKEIPKHNCSEVKIAKRKKSLHESNYNAKAVELIWDFYVTHTLSGGSGMSRTQKDYGWNSSTKELEEGLKDVAGIDGFHFVRAKSITQSLRAMDLADEEICAVHPRSVMKQNYTVSISETEELSLKNDESRIVSIFRHIRNALAHGNTYFFDNGYILLEDKNNNDRKHSKADDDPEKAKENELKQITAEILIKEETLLEWIFKIDKDEKYYSREMLEDDSNGSIDR